MEHNKPDVDPKWSSKTLLQNKSFIFFDLFRAILASKLAKKANMWQRNFWCKNSILVSKFRII
jgi:hypothetical protein